MEYIYKYVLSIHEKFSTCKHGTIHSSIYSNSGQGHEVDPRNTGNDAGVDCGWDS